MEYSDTIDPANESSAQQAEDLAGANTPDSKEEIKESNEKKVERPEKKTPSTNYEELDFQGIVSTAAALLQSKPIPELSETFKQLNAHFDAKFKAKLETEKEAFISGGGNEIDFYFNPPYKKEWEQISYNFRQQRRKYYRELEENQKANLERRKQIIDEIKVLIGSQDNINSVYNQFKALRDSWHKCGAVPRAESSNIWETYKHHVERFYDFLHLNRELRELDFKHNYEEKLKIIEQAETLAQSDNILKASRDLNTLHRLWKNDLGPVAKEHREDLWKRFQQATKIIHDKRHDYEKNIDQFQQQNLEKRLALLQSMEELIEKKVSSHRIWQQNVKRFNELRVAFQDTGQVPKAESKKTWNRFREAGRQFNRAKNEFYKQQKKEQKQAIDQRKALIDQVKSILEMEDWNQHSQKIKQLQNQWKKTGFVPRKIGDALWEEFRANCNIYFERLRGGYLQLSSQEEAVHEAQLALIKTVNSAEIPKEATEIQDFFLDLWRTCQTAGELNKSAAMKNGKAFVKAVQKRLKSSGLSSVDMELVYFEIRLAVFGNWGDTLIDEMTQIKAQIDQLKTEQTQLENNLEFFSNASSDNPLVREVSQKSEQLTQKIDILGEQFKRLKQAHHKLNKAEEEEASEESETDLED